MRKILLGGCAAVSSLLMIEVGAVNNATLETSGNISVSTGVLTAGTTGTEDTINIAVGISVLESIGLTSAKYESIEHKTSYAAGDKIGTIACDYHTNTPTKIKISPTDGGAFSTDNNVTGKNYKIGTASVGSDYVQNVDAGSTGFSVDIFTDSELTVAGTYQGSVEISFDTQA